MSQRVVDAYHKKSFFFLFPFEKPSNASPNLRRHTNFNIRLALVPDKEAVLHLRRIKSCFIGLVISRVICDLISGIFLLILHIMQYNVKLNFGRWFFHTDKRSEGGVYSLWVLMKYYGDIFRPNILEVTKDNFRERFSCIYIICKV